MIAQGRPTRSASLPPVPPNAVRVTAADWNGQEFDGYPFSDAPQWLQDALLDRRVDLVPSDTDYALWRVGKVVAKPGDLIEKGEDGSLRVVSLEEQRKR